MNPHDIDLARQALARLSPSRADDRESWIKVGMALHFVSSNLCGEWDQWSSQSAKYTPGECSKLWRSFTGDQVNVIGLGSLIRWAREDSGEHDFAKATNETGAPRDFASLDEAIVHVCATENGTRAGVWSYHAADGSIHFFVVRVDLAGVDALGKSKKTFRPIRLVGSRFALGDPKGKLPLYRLPKLAVGAGVVLNEGEKSAEAGVSIGLVATTSAHGAQAAAKSDWSPLAGRDVLIVPDNDMDGRTYARKAGALLLHLDPPARVRVLDLPDLPARGDLNDFVAARRAAGRTSEEIRAEFDLLAALAIPFASYEGLPNGDGSSFPDPIPLPADKPPVAAFDPKLLPRRLAPWASDIAERMQCPPDYIFVAIVIALSTIIGRIVGIRPKRFDIWTIIANLWGAVVGRPSLLKTPAVQEAFKPLRRLEKEAAEQYRRDLKSRKASQILGAARRKVRERDLRDAVKEGGGEEIAEQLACEQDDQPIEHRYVVNDSTVEKLGEILRDNPNGVLCYRDELVGLLMSLDKDGQEGARGFYLQAWNGDGSYTYDRIGRGTIHIPAAIVTILGCIQPGPFESYLRAAMVGGKGDDGLVQRFQLVVYPDPRAHWINHDRAPNREAREQAYAVFRELSQLDPTMVGAQVDEFEPDSVPFLRFSDDAQACFNAWREKLENRLLRAEEDEAFESHVSKYRKLVPALALIFHLADGHSGPVDLESLERAIAASIYLESHARRLFSSALSPEVAAAKSLAKRILKREVKDGFTLRDIYQKCWSRLATSGDVERAVEVLLDCQWLRVERDELTGGAPRTSYRINPKIWKSSGEEASNTPKTASACGSESGAGSGHEADITGKSPNASACDVDDAVQHTGTTGGTSESHVDDGERGKESDSGGSSWFFGGADGGNGGVHDA